MSKGIPEKKKKYWNKIDVPQKHEIFVALNNHLSLIVIEPNLKNKVKILQCCLVTKILFAG